VNAMLTTLARNAQLWIIHAANTIVVAHLMVVANSMVAVPHSVSVLTDGLDLTVRLMSTNVTTEMTTALSMPLATTPMEVMNVHVVLDMKEMEEAVEMDAQIPMNVSLKIITVVLNQSASTTMVVSHVNVNQDLLATHQLSDVPNQRTTKMKHHKDVPNSLAISTLTI